jgi:histidine ammonia-lyase
MPETIALSGQELSIPQLISVARNESKVTLSPGVDERVDASRAVLERMLDRRELVYGVNTGFGGSVKFAVPPLVVGKHQQNLLRFLCCGTGLPLPAEVTRRSVIRRANR